MGVVGVGAASDATLGEKVMEVRLNITRAFAQKLAELFHAKAQEDSDYNWKLVSETVRYSIHKSAPDRHESIESLKNNILGGSVIERISGSGPLAVGNKVRVDDMESGDHDFKGEITRLFNYGRYPQARLMVAIQWEDGLKLTCAASQIIRKPEPGPEK